MLEPLTTVHWKLGCTPGRKQLADELTLRSVLEIEEIMWRSDLNISSITFSSASSLTNSHVFETLHSIESVSFAGTQYFVFWPTTVFDYKSCFPCGIPQHLLSYSWFDAWNVWKIWVFWHFWSSANRFLTYRVTRLNIVYFWFSNFMQSLTSASKTWLDFIEICPTFINIIFT